MENKESDKDWKKAFQDAEATPSEATWSSIESHLMEQENISMKQSIVAYRRLAAAAVLFAIAVTAFGIYYISEHSSGETTKTENEKGPAITGSKDKNSATLSLSPAVVSGQQNVGLKTGKDPASAASLKDDLTGKNQQTSTQVAPMTLDPNDRQEHMRLIPQESIAGNQEIVHQNTLPGSGNEIVAPPGKTIEEESFKSNPANATSDTISDPRKKETESLIAVPPENKWTASAAADSEKVKSKIVYGEQFWISVGASVGNYSPGMKSKVDLNNSYLPNSLVSSSSLNINPKPGTYYSVGFLVGRRILQRWSIQSGIFYQNQTARFISDYVSPNSSVVAPGLTTSLAITSPSGYYPLTCSMEYISVPVQLGYKVSGKKLRVMLNTGASANFFVLNTLRDPSGQLKTYSEGPGSQSAYRNVSWSGLVNADFSYKMSGRYCFSIVPGMRYALSSSLKSNADRPFVLDIGFRLRYLFY